ncbi:MAG TPA: SGNH/GDSL hydrolase family protein [Terriglobia bacterium]|nr:SGNH/GDSL hydrolase family protein [Terriglobia bacterium]
MHPPCHAGQRKSSAAIFMLLLAASVGAWSVRMTPGSAAQNTARGSFYLKSGDRVVFYGDSITDQRLYTTFVENYVVTRFPRLKVSFVHSGWGGDRVTGGGGGPIDLRLHRDVIAYKPTVMTIMLGMNDGSYRAYDQQIFNTYAAGYKHIIDTVKGALPGIRITVIEPSPFDDVTRAPQFPGGYNAVLVRYGEFVKQLAVEDGLAVADMNTPLVAALEKARSADAELAQRIVPDRVHPGPGGHLIMAEALLKAWNAPAAVSAVEIDAAAKRVVHADNATVTELHADKSVAWTELDRALPMPVDLKDPVVELALRSSDFVQALDQEPLKVTGLAASSYQLKIDGDDVGRFSKEQLADGVNLAVLATPMAKQATAVHELTVKHNNVHFARWRNMDVPLTDVPSADKQAALGALDKVEADLVAEQHAAAQPKPHHFELVPAP